MSKFLFDKLSESENIILEIKAKKGWRSKEIAYSMCNAVTTINNHIQHIREKLCKNCIEECIIEYYKQSKDTTGNIDFELSDAAKKALKKTLIITTFVSLTFFQALQNNEFTRYRTSRRTRKYDTELIDDYETVY